MNSKTNSHILKALLDLAIFIEFGDDHVVDPDAAVEVLEQLAAELGLIDPAQRAEVAAQIVALASEYGDEERMKFVKEFPEAMGLQ